jgi:hypothetical protein
MAAIAKTAADFRMVTFSLLLNTAVLTDFPCAPTRGALYLRRHLDVIHNLREVRRACSSSHPHGWPRDPEA